MGRQTNSARGIRLPNELWEAIDAEAAGLGMSRSELLTKRLSVVFFDAPRNRKTVENSRNAEELVELP